MRRRFVWVACAVFILTATANIVLAQDSYRRLTTSDFRGLPRANGSNVIAHTKCSINFHYEATGSGNDFRLLFDVRLTVERDRSWIDMKRVTSQKMLDEILNHEQGHYTISYMEQQELLRQANRTRFDAYNYRVQASNLFNRIHAKYQELNQNYDIGTHNMRDAEQQRSWDVYFKKRLMFEPPVERVGY
jgi:hypothetical protein